MANKVQKHTPLDKQSKKAQKEFHLSQRTRVGFNTGTRIHKTDKHPSRARAKHMTRREGKG